MKPPEQLFNETSTEEDSSDVEAVIVQCKGCGKDFELELSPESGDDPDIHFCGGSPRCIP